MENKIRVKCACGKRDSDETTLPASSKPRSRPKDLVFVDINLAPNEN